MIYTTENVNIYGDAYASFKCPCDARQVYLTADKGHQFAFENGLLDVQGSIANVESEQDEYGYCHLFIKQGVVEFCVDATCAGVGQ